MQINFKMYEVNVELKHLWIDILNYINTYLKSLDRNLVTQFLLLLSVIVNILLFYTNRKRKSEVTTVPANIPIIPAPIIPVVAAVVPIAAVGQLPLHPMQIQLQQWMHQSGPPGPGNLMPLHLQRFKARVWAYKEYGQLSHDVNNITWSQYTFH